MPMNSQMGRQQLRFSQKYNGQSDPTAAMATIAAFQVGILGSCSTVL